MNNPFSQAIAAVSAMSEFDMFIPPIEPYLITRVEFRSFPSKN
jgi:hypothetical protein